MLKPPTIGATAKLRRRMLNPFLMRGFFLTKLPLALFAGLRLRELNEDRCVATVPYGWRSTNPFRSTYFAALSMAAELSTGALAMAAVESAPRPVAMLITGLTASFEKKATGLTTFTCTDGPRLFEAVAQTIATGEPVAVEIPTVGTSPDGAVVARFTFMWSFKVRR
jgi:acyl-coenzyme A thioesterase PaaI-like protein